MPWPSWLTPTEVKFDKSPFWVRISGIPPFYWTKTDLEELAAKVSPNDKLPKYIDFERGSFGMGTDTRETRRQLLGKRRLVEQVMEELPATNEIRVSHFSMVTLPGVGEVCPLEDTATLVVPQGHENLLVLDPQNDKHDGDSTIGPKHRAS
uniref:DUF4283 domain-containing protein n=1 Tax=Cannabis sativa TaxID=3483 RepID=A0A803P959_CANSA